MLEALGSHVGTKKPKNNTKLKPEADQVGHVVTSMPKTIGGFEHANFSSQSPNKKVPVKHARVKTTNQI